MLYICFHVIVVLFWRDMRNISVYSHNILPTRVSVDAVTHDTTVTKGR